MMDGSTSGAIKKIIHDFVTKFLSITCDLATSTLELCLILTLIIEPKFSLFLLTPVLSPLYGIPNLVELFLPLRIDVPLFNLQDEVVKYNATPDPHDCPKMFLMSVDLNAELKQGLKPAFQTTNHMFNVDADLQRLIDR
jgi:hypothetical protein